MAVRSSKYAWLLHLAVLLGACKPAVQRSDPSFRAGPGPSTGASGPVVLVDEAHGNYHTAVGRYRPFAQVLRQAGYHVRRSRTTLTPRALQRGQVLVVANALARQNLGVDRWVLPTPSAFSTAEVRAVRAWVHGGGALLERGQGRVAVFAEGAMFTAQRTARGRRIGMHVPAARGNRQLLINVLGWLSRRTKQGRRR